MQVQQFVRKMPVFLLIVVPLMLAGCEGDPGPAGPQGPAGPPGENGENIYQYTYVGTAGTPCNHCHAEVVENVLHTRHSLAYADLGAENQENPYCLQCHTTGWDSPIGYGETTITNPGPDLNGYDNYWGVAGDLAAGRRADLAGVQCEACHGAMGPSFNDHAPPELTMATVVGPNYPADVVSPCFRCHSTQFAEDEYPVSGHGTASAGNLEEFRAEWGRASCAACHTSEGFVQANDPDYANWTPEEYNFIGCVTCHDPHQGPVDGGVGNTAQLRNLNPIAVLYNAPYDPDNIPRMEGYGTGQLCAQCHHARRDNTAVAAQIAGTSSLSGPHRSPQMDMFIGYGSYEIPGRTYSREHQHQSIAVACVQCHMRREVTLHDELQEHSFHSFAPNPANCAACHQNLTDFNYVGGQDRIEAKMNELAAKYGYASYALMVASSSEGGWNSRAPGVTTWQREAAYALYFVYNDGSRGVHNPDYALSLLQNAIDYYDAPH